MNKSVKRSEDDHFLLGMYADILMSCISRMNHIKKPKLQIKFIEASAEACRGNFWFAPILDDTKIDISIPENCSVDTMKEDLEITVFHEFAHYEYARKKLRTSVRRRLDIQRYYNEDGYAIKDEERTWLRTREIAKELGLWNRKSLVRCLKGSSAATVLL